MKRLITILLASVILLSMSSAFAMEEDERIIYRMSGANRYETSVMASQIGWEDGSDVVVLACGGSWSDAVAGIPIASAYDAPLLLTPFYGLDLFVRDEIKRLQAKKVIIVGGLVSIPTSIENELKSGYEVERIYGDDRYYTSLAIADYLYTIKPFDSIALVTGKEYADGITAGPYAANNNMAIIYVDSNGITPDMQSAFTKWGIKNVTIIGGEAAVPKSVSDYLINKGYAVERLWGANRYDTSSITQSALYTTADSVIVASGETFADALAGGTLAIRLNAPLVLATKTSVQSNVQGYIKSLSAEKAYIMGGLLALEQSVRDSVYKNLSSYTMPYATVDISKAAYTYNEMLIDLEQLAQTYPTLTTLENIAVSEYGRDIPMIIIGNPDADKKVLIHGSIHAREYVSTLLIMRQIETYLSNIIIGEIYEERTYDSILNETALYIVPMVNPDGVMLSQQGLNSIAPEDTELRERLVRYNNGSSNFTLWKANINGVDLNLNFDANWQQDYYYTSPGPYRYSGEAPFDQLESQMLRDITIENDFDMTVSYHSKGNIIFWLNDQQGNDYYRDLDIANQVSAITGYTLKFDSGYNALWGGYKDWYIQEYKKPGFTIELGPNYASHPVKIVYFDDIYEANIDVPIHLAYLTGD